MFSSNVMKLLRNSLGVLLGMVRKFILVVRLSRFVRPDTSRRVGQTSYSYLRPAYRDRPGPASLRRQRPDASERHWRPVKNGKQRAAAFCWLPVLLQEGANSGPTGKMEATRRIVLLAASRVRLGSVQSYQRQTRPSSSCSWACGGKETPWKAIAAPPSKCIGSVTSGLITCTWLQERSNACLPHGLS